jgi:hypothetical protein
LAFLPTGVEGVGKRRHGKPQLRIDDELREAEASRGAKQRAALKVVAGGKSERAASR